MVFYKIGMILVNKSVKGRRMKMKLKKSKMAALLLVFALAFGILPAAPAQAAAPKIAKKLQYYMYEGFSDVTMYVYLEYQAAKGKVSQIKNSNPSVAKVTAGPKNGSLSITLRAEGTTKVTFKYAKKKYTTRITVTKWESPCKTFKIGSRNYAKYFEKSGQYNLNNQKKDITAKIKVTPKSGWRLQKIERFTSTDAKPQKVKNNSKVKLTMDDTGTGVYAYFKNTKTKEIRRLYFGYSGFATESGNIYNFRVE